MANETKTKTAESGKSIGEAGVNKGEPLAKIEETVLIDGKEAGKIDVSGFARESLAGKSDADGTLWAKLHVDRRMYKPESCAKHGGVEGYLVAMESFQSDTIKSEKNPDGWFDALIMRATRPFPYADDVGMVKRGEPGEDVIVVVTDRLKRLMELCQDPEFVYQLRVLPTEKIKLVRKNRHLWRYVVDVNPNKIPRSKVGIEAQLGLSEGDKTRAKMLLEKSVTEEPDAGEAGQSPAASA